MSSEAHLNHLAEGLAALPKEDLTNLVFTPAMEKLALKLNTPMSQRLREIESDPMWANHCEINKRTLIKAAEELEQYCATALTFQEYAAHLEQRIRQMELSFTANACGRMQ